MSKKKGMDDEEWYKMMSAIEKLLADDPEIGDKLVQTLETEDLTPDSVCALSELIEFTDVDSIYKAYEGIEPKNGELPEFIDFWHKEGVKLCDTFTAFKKACNGLSKKKQATAINQYLETIPHYYNEKGEYNISLSHIVMIAYVIIQNDLGDCHRPFMQLLRMEYDIVLDLFLGEDDMATTVFAEVCHDGIDDLYALALDESVCPIGRGVAIGAIVKMRILYPELTLKVNALVNQILENYKKSAKTNRYESVAMIRATSLLCAFLHFEDMLPGIEAIYRSLRISGKGHGAIDRVRKLMEGTEHTCYSTKHLDEDYIKDFFSFLDRADLMQYMDDDEEDSDDFEYDDYESDFDDYDDEDYDDPEDYYDDEDEDVYIKLHPDKDRKSRLERILPIDFVSSHPKGIGTATDSDYVKMANDLLAKIHKENLVCNDLEKLVAFKATLYLEDMIADAGIWRSFVCKHNGMYGKKLPFFQIDNNDYYEDEPNLADVKLLVWLAAMDITKHESVLHCETMCLMQLADFVYEYLTDAFEKMPVNEALKEYFVKASFMNNFYEARDAMKWTFFSSYVSHNSHNDAMVAEEVDEFNSLYGKQTFYQVESLQVYDTCFGPLALEAKDWLSMILKANGNSEQARDIEAVRGTMQCFHVVKREKGVYTLISPDGTKITMKRKNFGVIISEQEDYDYVFCCLLYFKREWYLSGNAIWGDFDEKFIEEKEHYAEVRACMIKDYDKIIEKHMHSPVFYFKTKDSINKFIKNEINARVEKGGEISLKTDDDEEWMLYLTPNTENVQSRAWVAYFISDPRNPCFDQMAAYDDNNLSNLIAMPYGVFSYVQKHHYYVNVYVLDEYGVCGNGMFDENADFIYRIMHPDYVMYYNTMIK